MQQIKQRIIQNLKNIPGWRTSRKILIIECDDWGGIRTPSKEVCDKLIKEGIQTGTGRFRYDTLESEQDLRELFTVLNSVKDKNSHSAVMTPVSNMANPDFEKIKKSGFTEYHYEKFTETLLRYGRGDCVIKLWKQGIEEEIFVPELHGREHITVQIWLRNLRDGNRDLLTAFENEVASVNIIEVPEVASGFRPEFYFDSEEQKPFLNNSIIEGVSLFKEIFDRSPKVFVPSNGIFHPDFETSIVASGIKFLYVDSISAVPLKNGKLTYKHYITGQSGIGGLTYYTRNCAFEPTSGDYKGIGFTMSQIEAAFRWGKPANISSHRVNFVGGIEPAIRDHGLKELKTLLKAIVNKWPDVEFMSSSDALEFMKNTN